MKVAILTKKIPFTYGGAEFLADSLCDKCREYGYETDVIQIPFSWTPTRRILDSMLAVQLLHLENTDLVVGLKFPAYYVDHPNKRLWLLHQFRQAYDLYGTDFNLFNSSAEDNNIRNSIIEADNHFLKPLEGRIFTNSHIVSERLMKYNNIKSQVLYPPLMDAELFKCGETGDYIFCPSRVNKTKRQYLLVQAMQYTKTPVRLVLAGKGDTQEDERYIFSLIEKYGVQDKVTYYNRFISQDEKATLFSNCLAGTYIPYDEDSYGYVSLESIHSGKPLISCKDSGGTDIVVKDAIDGYMVDSSPTAIAESMDKLYANKRNAAQMGKNGVEILKKLGINWETVMERLIK